MKARGPFFGAVVFVSLLVLATLMTNGCSSSDTSGVHLDGEKGQSCTYDKDCRSNSCVYPGICD